MDVLKVTDSKQL